MTTSFLLLALWIPSAAAGDELIDYEHLVRAAPLPAAYAMQVKEVKQGDRLAGTVLVVAKDGSRSNVVVSIENRELPTDNHKRAAAKAHVNGTAKALFDAYYNLVDEELPDLDNADFTKPIDTKLTLKNGDNQVLYVNIRSIFTNRGYQISVMSTSLTDRELLNAWAQTIQPLPVNDVEKPRRSPVER